MEWLNELFGYVYLVNLHSGEIHNLRNEHRNCKLGFISLDHRRYVTKRKAMKLIASGGFNGCRWCMGEKDTDKW